MIFFLSTRWNRHPIDRYLASWGAGFRSGIQPLMYEDFLGYGRFLPGVYFFADLELLTDAQRERATEIWQHLDRRGEDVLLFNHPGRSLRRYDLLRMLHDEGFNRFAARRSDEDLQAVRFPAFIRNENDHRGYQVAPVSNTEELERSLAELRATKRDRSTWLITEFCDTAGQDGIFRKYSAFMLNGHVIPRHVFFSRSWCQKSADLVDDVLLAEEASYVRTNPHESRIREIFDSASIDYGRIDYGILDGNLQVWEINTNPMIASFETYASGPRLGIHELFCDRMSAVWRQLLQEPPARHRDNYRGQAASAALYRLGEWPRIRALREKPRVLSLEGKLRRKLRVPVNRLRRILGEPMP